VIAGTGGLARLLAAYLRDTEEYELAGFTDPDAHRKGDDFLGAQILGGDDAAIEAFNARQIACAFNGLGDSDMRLRAQVFDLLLAAGIEMPAFVHTRASVASDVLCGAGVVVLPQADIGPYVKLGVNVLVDVAAAVSHDCILADHVYVAHGAVLGGGVQVGARAMIGLNATVLPNVKVGADAVIGAGAVVLGDVPDAATVAGVPARSLR
jgi:UDP-perosamine 4-acetyltransferase